MGNAGHRLRGDDGLQQEEGLVADVVWDPTRPPGDARKDEPHLMGFCKERQIR